LIKTVVGNSYANTWSQDVNEWEITDCIEDASCTDADGSE